MGQMPHASAPPGAQSLQVAVRGSITPQQGHRNMKTTSHPQTQRPASCEAAGSAVRPGAPGRYGRLGHKTASFGPRAPHDYPTGRVPAIAGT